LSVQPARGLTVQRRAAWWRRRPRRRPRRTPRRWSPGTPAFSAACFHPPPSSSRRLNRASDPPLIHPSHNLPPPRPSCSQLFLHRQLFATHLHRRCTALHDTARHRHSSNRSQNQVHLLARLPVRTPPGGDANVGFTSGHPMSLSRAAGALSTHCRVHPRKEEEKKLWHTTSLSVLIVKEPPRRLTAPLVSVSTCVPRATGSHRLPKCLESWVSRTTSKPVCSLCSLSLHPRVLYYEAPRTAFLCHDHIRTFSSSASSFPF
jgi:hypothetical protein